MEEQIQKLREMLSQSRNTVAVTGAGISMAAGIRDMQHLNFLEVVQLMSESVLKSSPTHYYKIAWKNFLQPMFEKGPTVTHKTLARLEGEGKLRGIITTNIDCLHTLCKQAYTLLAGDIMIVLPHTVHSIEQAGTEKGEYYNIVFAPRFLREMKATHVMKNMSCHL